MDSNINNIPASVIIIAQNEEDNIEYCLRSLLPFFDDIWVIDSYSEDKTVSISLKYGAKVLKNSFIHWADQRNWALSNAILKNEWIMFLDADEQVTREFCNELRDKIRDSSPQVGGMNVRFDFFFLNRKLRFAYEAVPVLRVIRKGRAFWEGKGAREYANVDGGILTLKNRLTHWDKGLVTKWISKQNRNAVKESNLIEIRCNKLQINGNKERVWRQLIRNNIWKNIPRYFRPMLYFIYRYFLKGGFIDGKAGFAYCFLAALWYQMLIDIMLIEKEIDNLIM